MTGRPAMTLLHLGPDFANGIANLHNVIDARNGSLRAKRRVSCGAWAWATCCTVRPPRCRSASSAFSRSPAPWLPTPKLLLLDEPAAGLRFAEKQQLAGVLRELRDSGMSILLVEHDMALVMGLADRIVAQNFGKKLAEGDPAFIQSHPEVRAAYLGGQA